MSRLPWLQHKTSSGDTFRRQLTPIEQRFARAAALDLTVTLARARFDRANIEPSPEELKRIQKIALVDMQASDVYVRRQFLANDQINVMGARFSKRALGQIAKLMSDAKDPVPVIRNHDQYGAESLPIARYFQASVIETPDSWNWVQADMFWSRARSDAEDMRLNIDHGIWRESSIGVLLRSFLIDIDGKQIGDSDYWPGQKLSDGRIVEGIMDDVEEVIEGSFVVRGAQQSTHMTLRDGRTALWDRERIELARTRRSSETTDPRGSTIAGSARTGGESHA